jgi:putative ABC transport system permease protein
MAPSPFAAHVRTHLPPLGLDPDREAEIVEELAQQMEQTYEAARAAGADHTAAERAAHAVVGDWARLARELIDAERSKAEQAARRIARPVLAEPDGGRIGPMLAQTWQDARYGLRWLGRHPGFTSAALLTLSLTIGASSAIFSLVSAVLLAPLPFPDDRRIVAVDEAAPGIGFARLPFSPLDFQDFVAGQRSFGAVAAYRNGSVELAGAGESQRIDIAVVSPSLFDVLGVQPSLGRAFAADDARPGADAAILSHALWTRHFAADPDVVGRRVLLDRRPFVVIGVMPERAVFPQVGPLFNGQPADVLVPLAFSEQELRARGNYYANSVLARLTAGASLEAARAEAATLAGTSWAQYPAEVQAAFENTAVTWVLTPYRDAVSGRSRLLVLVLLGTVLLLLLAGCTNLGSLLLALTSSRQRELAVRASLGAGRLRLARQLLAESLVLSGIGAVLGLGVAWALVRAAPLVLPATMPRVDVLTIDARVLLFTATAALLTAVVFGLAPAWRWSRVSPASALTVGASRGATGAGSARMRRGLAVAQCAFAVLLLVPAALLGRTLFALLARTPGFDVEQTLTFSTYLPLGAYAADGVRVRGFYTDALERLATVPGVRRVGLSMDQPMAPLEHRAVMIEGHDPSASPPVGVYSWITPGYLEALGVPIAAGRGLRATDRRGGEMAVVVNETAARQFWPGEDAVGKRLRGGLDTPWLTVAGVVGDVRDAGLDSAPAPHVYAPLAGVEDEFLGENVVGLFRQPSVVVSTTAPPEAVGGLLRQAMQALDPQLAVTPPVRLRDGVLRTVSTQRLAAVVVGVFSLAALLIAAAGLHGVLAFGVAQRRRELGIRLALGATAANVVRLVARDGLVLAVAGLGLGLLVAYGAGGAIRGLLVGVSPTDPMTFVGVALGVFAVAVVAMWAPARAATRIDPSATIREM